MNREAQSREAQRHSKWGLRDGNILWSRLLIDTKDKHLGERWVSTGIIGLGLNSLRGDTDGKATEQSRGGVNSGDYGSNSTTLK